MSTESKAEKAKRELLEETLAVARTNHLAKHVPLDGAPRYGSSQTWPKRTLTREDRVPAFLADVIGVWIGGFEGREKRKHSFEGRVWTERAERGRVR